MPFYPYRYQWKPLYHAHHIVQFRLHLKLAESALETYYLPWNTYRLMSRQIKSPVQSPENHSYPVSLPQALLRHPANDFGLRLPFSSLQ